MSPDRNSQKLKLGVTTLKLQSAQDRAKRKSDSSMSKSALKRRRQTGKDVDSNGLTLHILSQRSGKVALSTVASSLLHSRFLHDREKGQDPRTNDEEFCVTLEDLKASLEGEHGFPPPDLMIVHSLTPRKYYKVPLELHGFPPWQIRLTEIYYDEHPRPFWPINRTPRRPVSALEEVEFRRALDLFASAEMRLGR